MLFASRLRCDLFLRPRERIVSRSENDLLVSMR
jgi:hypothetical protein